MARAFDSTAKKLAIPLFAIFEIGWIVFIAGFILLFKSKIRDIILDDNDIKSPVYFPYYMILVGGHFVILLGLLHATLPSGTASSYIGSISTVLNIIYFVSVGYLISNNCIVILHFKLGKYFQKVPVDHDDEQQLMRAASLMLAGSIMFMVSWSLVQFVSFFYEHRPQPVLTRNLWYVIVECWKNRTILVGDVSESVRLASTLAMLLSAIGWGIYMAGLFNMDIIFFCAFSYSWWLECCYHSTFHVSCISLPCWMYRGGQHCIRDRRFHTQHLLYCRYGVLSYFYSCVPLPNHY